MNLTQDYASSAWLQAFMGANDPILQRARLESKKYIDQVEVLCSLTTIREKREQISSSLDSLWSYCQANELGWLLCNVPAAQKDWVLPSNDDFTIHCDVPPTIESAKDLGCALGIYDWSTPVTMKLRSADFTTWQRRISRVGSGAPVGFTMATSNTDFMNLESVAIWTANQWVDGTWTFQIKDQPNMKAEIEEPIQVARPKVDSHMDSILLSIGWADNALRATKNNSPVLASVIPGWLPTGDPLVPVHECVFGGKNALRVSKVFVNTWEAVWPMLYCRRRKLARGHCELKVIRDRIDQALTAEPKLFCWMALFGELLNQTFTTDGLGISAKFEV